MKKDILFIVMPAYNEEETIKQTVEEWYKVLEGKNEKSRLLVADAGSKDNTHSILENLKKEYPKLEILSDSKKEHGPKLIYLYNYSIDHNADYIFQTDSDGQTKPDEFDCFWNERKKYDALIGNRTKREDGTSRAFVEKVVCFLLRVYFGIKVPDANAPFRLMKSTLVKKYIDRLPKDYNLPNIMLTTYFAYYKENIKFNVISFKPRQGGVNSINIKKIIKIGIKAIKDFRNFRKGMKNDKSNKKI